jgi:hypothetical protein
MSCRSAGGLPEEGSPPFLNRRRFLLAKAGNREMQDEVRAVVDEGQRVVHIVVPRLGKLTEDEQRAVLARPPALRREREAKGYSVRY